jgi:hypothetical protein
VTEVDPHVSLKLIDSAVIVLPLFDAFVIMYEPVDVEQPKPVPSNEKFVPFIPAASRPPERPRPRLKS